MAARALASDLAATGAPFFTSFSDTLQKPPCKETDSRGYYRRGRESPWQNSEFPAARLLTVHFGRGNPSPTKLVVESSRSSTDVTYRSGPALAADTMCTVPTAYLTMLPIVVSFRCTRLIYPNTISSTPFPVSPVIFVTKIGFRRYRTKFQL